MSRAAIRYLEPIETAARGVAVLDALAEMIERAGLQVGDRLGNGGLDHQHGHSFVFA